MLNKEAQYTAVYFPHEMIKDKDEFLFALQDIDANISKIVRELMPEIMDCIDQILEDEQTYRHYDWKVSIVDKQKEKARVSKLNEKRAKAAAKTRKINSKRKESKNAKTNAKKEED